MDPIQFCPGYTSLVPLKISGIKDDSLSADNLHWTFKVGDNPWKDVSSDFELFELLPNGRKLIIKIIKDTYFNLWKIRSCIQVLLFDDWNDFRDTVTLQHFNVDQKWLKQNIMKDEIKATY